MKLKKLLGLLVAFIAVFAVASCETTEKPTPDPGKPVEPGDNRPKTYTYNTYTAISPSNWNELTYEDNNDTQIMSYIGSSFFSYDFKFDQSGEIIPGEFEVTYEAATKLEDVSADYDLPAYRAYKITLREDLKWDDATAISAEDFVYTMKEQLDPAFQHYRRDSFYVGATVIKNAENYAKQGTTQQAGLPTIYNNGGYSSIAEMLANPEEANRPAFVNWNYSFGYEFAKGGEGEAAWVPVSSSPADEIVATGYTMAEIYDCFSFCIINYFGLDQATADEYFMNETYYDYTFGAMDFKEVGIFVGNTPYELVVVLDKALQLVKEDGSLDYKAAYNFSSLPLVHKAKWEANKQAPAVGSTLWTSKYNSSVSTTASWGPYKLTDFQTGRQYTLERNKNWYGYGLEENEGLYQTDKIVCDTIKEWGTAWLDFQAGKIDGIGIDVTIADDYKGSERAYFTPDDFVSSLQLQSNIDELVKRQSAGVNKAILGYTDFRQALSLGINRAEFARQTTTSSLAGFGLFNSMHYYDVANGKAYRNEDVAKQVLCDVYGVDVNNYSSLDEAHDAITGYNLELARELVTKAYNEALAAGDIKADDKVVLTLGTGAINETVTRRFDFIKASWTELMVGTPLEGKIEFEVKDYADAWAEDFREGLYDVCMGGWTGAAWDPGYFLLAYLSPDYMYSTAWDTSSQMLEFTMPGVGADGSDVTDTLSLMDWYDCLNGAGDAKYQWGAGQLEEAKRLLLIAALEKEVLSVYYTVPLYNNFSASLLSYQVDYVTYEYNTFMAYGGIKYMTYNFTDLEWEEAVEAAGGTVDYK